jgi:3-phytase/alkaline phosphatase D
MIGWLARSAFLILLALAETAWAAAASPPQLRYLGAAALESGFRFKETLVGGLSGLTYDATADCFHAISDDASQSSPARFYTLRIDLRDARLESGDIEFLAVTLLRDRDGEPFEELTLDPEAIALTPAGTLWIGSEGQVKRGISPFVREFSPDGSTVGELSLPNGALAAADGRSGPRHNLAFESVALSPDGKWLFVASENAWIQDGPAADVGVRSPVRILRYEAKAGRLDAAYVYWAEPIPGTSASIDGFRVGGLVELLALDQSTLLSLERSYSLRLGHGARLYQLSLEGATDVRAVSRLSAVAADDIQPVHKTLVLDLREIEEKLDNMEGMALGPELPDGRRTLVIVSDDNFNPYLQDTRFLAFALGVEAGSRN